MTSVLFVGDLNPFTRSEQRYRALRSLGLHARGLSFVPVGAAPGEKRPALVDRLRSRLGRPRDAVGVNAAILDELEREPVDLLWIDKGPNVRPSTLARVKRRHPALTLLFHSDDDMAARHNQNAYFRAAVPLFDVVVTAKSYNLAAAELPALGARRVIFARQAFDPEFHRPLAIDAATRQRLGAEVGFVGTFERDRAERMLYLAEHGVVVRVFGNRWQAWRGRHANLRIEGRAIYGDDYIRCLSATDINLGFLRKTNRDLHTSRTLDIPACGAFYLAERTAEQTELFREGVEADYFSSNEEMLAKVRHHLEHKDQRQRIAAAGRRRCIDAGYDHASAIRAVLDRALERV